MDELASLQESTPQSFSRSSFGADRRFNVIVRFRQNTFRGRTTRNIPELELGISDSIPLTEYFPFRALTPFCDRFHAAASFPSLLLAPLGKVAVGQRKCYLLFREGKILSCAPGQNQNGGWL
jgi:hypothetical protein